MISVDPHVRKAEKEVERFDRAEEVKYVGVGVFPRWSKILDRSSRGGDDDCSRVDERLVDTFGCSNLLDSGDHKRDRNGEREKVDSETHSLQNGAVEVDERVRMTAGASRIKGVIKYSAIALVLVKPYQVGQVRSARFSVLERRIRL